MDQTQKIQVKDHTGARHELPIYDAGKALSEAIVSRETRPIQQPAREIKDAPWTDWNGMMRGRERG